MTAPSLSDAPLWLNFERRVLTILRRALELLADADPELDGPRLNELLAARLKTANFQITKETGDGLDFLPSYDGHQYPSFEPDGTPSVANPKRPDFTWTWQDSTADTEDEMTREFVVECKRLGDKGTNQFDRRYVVQGIVRFVDPAHSYGRAAPRGAMVGYVQSSDRSTILAAIQLHLSAKSLPALSPAGQPDAQIAEFRHALDRSFDPSPFDLLHFWIDLIAVS